MAAVKLSETDQVRIATETAETFVDVYYNALNGARNTIKDYYVPPSETTPGRHVPYISYNGEVSNDGAVFQKEFEQMPFTFFEVQSVDAQVLNPTYDPNNSKTQREAERNMSISIQVGGYVRLQERKDGPMRGFSDNFVLVPNKDVVAGRGTRSGGHGRQFLVQSQNFRFVV